MSKAQASKEKITRVEDAAASAAREAIKAYCQATISVGGILIDTHNGNVIHRLHNDVIRDNYTFDPTAHGERQLVDWYFEHHESLSLPPPNQMAIVTSLDPCCMCAGAVLTAGFHVVVSASDDFAGINYDGTASFPALTHPAKAKRTFSYPAVVGTSCFAREKSGAPLPGVFQEPHIEEPTQALNLTMFQATINSVRTTINTDTKPDPQYDLGTLCDGHALVRRLRREYPDSLQYRAPTPGVPEVGLSEYLLKTSKLDKVNGGNGDAVALLDAFGNLLLSLPGHIGASPIRTSFMETTRAFARLRYEAIVEQKIPNAAQYLLHPKFGTFVFYRCPNDSFRDLVDLGAYSSTMEGELPHGYPANFQYAQKSTLGDIQTYIDGLPPFYSQLVKMSPKRLEDNALIRALPPISAPPIG